MRPPGREMLKVERPRSADRGVGGFRQACGTRQVGSLLLGLCDDTGKLDHDGLASAISDAERPALAARLDNLLDGTGSTGEAPGGPNR